MDEAYLNGWHNVRCNKSKSKGPTNLCPVSRFLSYNSAWNSIHSLPFDTLWNRIRDWKTLSHGCVCLFVFVDQFQQSGCTVVLTLLWSNSSDTHTHTHLMSCSVLIKCCTVVMFGLESIQHTVYPSGPDTSNRPQWLALTKTNRNVNICTWTHHRDYSWRPAERWHARMLCACMRGNNSLNVF